ncbi:MAG: bifunctional folylpolyglutamate synthase/dihydrofolate synthase, partial [Lachnospiraceae bacterium]|nr:bifunctional folylpolyglutamate synthase/dihydrofolate synthase [Lachnospiraceae bacterium]
MNYGQAMEYIQSLSARGIVPGLDSIRELCERLGNPQKQTKWIHVAGTNGKGSAVAYITAILSKAGYRVGCYVSPTIRDYRERICVDGGMISKVALAEGMTLVKEACDTMVSEGLPQPTPFEVETALAFWYFQKKKCDLGVLECGMGGL